jgi:XTP/dITP diphosphohydrolase
VRVVVASRNRGKLAEYRRMFRRLGVEVESLEQAGIGPAVRLPEDEDSFEANARSKCRALQRMIGGWVMGDDSGLEVDALDGAPGVFSARYAGWTGEAKERDRANLEKLLSALQGVPDEERSARFVCAIVLLGPAGQDIAVRGTCEGRIARDPRGTSGFGYDPVFLPEGYERTMAQLSMDEKNRISHRGRALAALMEEIRNARLNV